MLKISAPDVASKGIIFLPDPEWGDVQRLEQTMLLYRSMNGNKVITHVQPVTNIRTFEYSFILTRFKALEFINFYNIFGSQRMKLEVDANTIKVGYLKVNPLELEYIRRAVQCTSNEDVSTQFAFESVV